MSAPVQVGRIIAWNKPQGLKPARGTRVTDGGVLPNGTFIGTSFTGCPWVHWDSNRSITWQEMADRFDRKHQARRPMWRGVKAPKLTNSQHEILLAVIDGYDFEDGGEWNGSPKDLTKDQAEHAIWFIGDQSVELVDQAFSDAAARGCSDAQCEAYATQRARCLDNLIGKLNRHLVALGYGATENHNEWRHVARRYL